VTNSHLGRVVFWMTGALFSFSISAVAIRALSQNGLSVFEILSIRSGCGLLFLLLLLLLRHDLRNEILPLHMMMHLWRNSTHFVGQYLWAWAVTLLPLATVFALEFTTPMWVAILAVPLLGERLTVPRVGSVVLGILGVLVIVRPGLASFQPNALLVLFAAFMFAISLIVTKQLTNRVSTFAIIFWMNLMQLPMALAWPGVLAATGGPSLFVFRLGSDLLIPTLALGAVGLTSHYCLTQAFRSGDATVVVPLDFVRIPLIALIGWMFYGEALDGFVFAGAGLIICGVLWNLLAESRRSRSPVAASTEKAQTAES
jgi:drug/metabolite transporter (DMT)-like permease